jgi:hypothetical protein
MDMDMDMGLHGNRARRISRGVGGVMALAGVGCGVRALFAPWLRVHVFSDDPKPYSRTLFDDTLPRKLHELSANGWVFIALGLLVVLAAASASERVRVSGAAAAVSLPGCALAVIATLNAQGTIRWWGGAPLTRYDDDRPLAMTTASGGAWALAAAALLTVGALLLALAGAERRTSADETWLKGISGYAG